MGKKQSTKNQLYLQVLEQIGKMRPIVASLSDILLDHEIVFSILHRFSHSCQLHMVPAAENLLKMIPRP